MTRALSSSWRLPSWVSTLLSALILIALASSTALAGKPTVAILGLEVVDASGNIDQTTTAVAHDLTEGLRSRAKAGAGPYQLATGSDKELIDEKLINNCDTEAIACMSEIGKNLGADYLIYGRLEKRPDGYAVTINLLNVGKKKLEKAKSPLMIAQRDTAAVAAASRKAYNDLTGTSELGTLVVQANAQRGTVLLDEEPKGNLNSGTATLTGLKEGRYRLAIEADGYARSPDVVVTIRSGETTTQPVTLVEGAKGAEPGPTISRTGTTSQSESNIWKPVFVVSLAATAGLAGYSAFAFYKQGTSADELNMASNKPVGTSDKFGPSDCNSADADVTAFLKEPCKWHKQHKYTAYAAVGVGVVVVGSGILAFMRGSSERSAPVAAVPPSTGHRARKKRQFSVTPVVSVDGGGATFQIDW
ncbi:MAG: hypothetical protein JWP01_587 [Myxococcales bacterium]|nr:hypothetical protein [Myxococcales bacterium]